MLVPSRSSRRGEPANTGKYATLDSARPEIVAASDGELQHRSKKDDEQGRERGREGRACGRLTFAAPAFVV